jgi:hypothetical protein
MNPIGQVLNAIIFVQIVEIVQSAAQQKAKASS